LPGGRRAGLFCQLRGEVDGGDHAGVFESQIAGGKRSDLAVAGRRRAQATFFESHATDRATAVTFAMDLTPLIANPDIVGRVTGLIEQFKADVERKLRR